MTVGQVQKWVLSSLAVTTITHMSAGLVIAALFVDESRPSARIGLLVIAGLFGVIGVVAARAIHEKHPLSPWPILGFLPTLIGTYLAFWR